MTALLEPLILYIILFTPGNFNSVNDFSAVILPKNELYRIFMFIIPSIALIWHLIFLKPGFNKKCLKPGKSDFYSLLIALPGLLLCSLVIAKIAQNFPNIEQGPVIRPPSDPVTWLILCISCMATGYLEESFFRFYLLSKYDAPLIKHVHAVIISVLLFSACHVYEGPWGILNAAIAGLVLAFIFLRFKSLHGIAVSHGLYNILVYIIYSIYI
jgi:membrane protease YdiL (CAAX protease family)